MPNRIIVPALVVALVVQTALDPSVEWIVASLGAGAFFLVAALVYPAGLGMGDVKLAAFLGAWLGAAVVVALFAGSLLALVPAVVILATQGTAGRKVGIPFAPFLAGGGVIALFFGDVAPGRLARVASSGDLAPLGTPACSNPPCGTRRSALRGIKADAGRADS